MKPVTFALVVAVVAVACDPASACGRRKAATQPAVVYYRPAPAYPPAAGLPPMTAPAAFASAPAATPAPALAPTATATPAPAPPAATPTAPVGLTVDEAPAAGPRYAYDPEPGAYYYSYDENGKLIVRRWMDWVFRGGREAGMPRPPLPVVGWFTGR